MSNVHDPPLADYSPPAKRPRVADPIHQSPLFAPGPSAPSTPTHPDQDGVGDAASKKNRKRPLSCGECRRCVSYSSCLFSLACAAHPRVLLPSSTRLKLKVRSPAALVPRDTIFNPSHPV